MGGWAGFAKESTQELTDCVWYYREKGRFYIRRNGSNIFNDSCEETAAIPVLCIFKLKFNSFVFHSSLRTFFPLTTHGSSSTLVGMFSNWNLINLLIKLVNFFFLIQRLRCFARRFVSFWNLKQFSVRDLFINKQYDLISLCNSVLNDKDLLFDQNHFT